MNSSWVGPVCGSSTETLFSSLEGKTFCHRSLKVERTSSRWDKSSAWRLLVHRKLDYYSMGMPRGELEQLRWKEDWMRWAVVPLKVSAVFSFMHLHVILRKPWWEPLNLTEGTGCPKVTVKCFSIGNLISVFQGHIWSFQNFIKKEKEEQTHIIPPKMISSNIWGYHFLVCFF